ncbi:hypothetical protein EGT74_14960 [Chitinophaga lutea]|uniref:DUF4595 domain-containing protein n=1 Tax=Chitinophaga lutea TaxID=2488634 RepID=A0A3N4PNW7_9BACT|nr:RHS repeat domain-containing protein [Chitinophaga lutea]RPE08349.1 hypothetical protein EGT74_14960 [Chitinophaga lutea]
MKKTVFLLLIAGAAFTACKKDKNNGGQPNITKYITKMTEKDAEGLETTIDFTWNAKNQLVTLTDSDGPTRTFTYDGAGRLIKQKMENGDESEEYTFTYTAAGLPEKYVRRSVDGNGDEGVFNGVYTITDGKVSKIFEKDTDPESGHETYVEFGYAANNLATVTAVAGNNGTQDPVTKAVITLTHGSKRNPAAAMQLKYALTSELAIEAYSANEIKTLTMKFLGNTLTSTTTYEYDAAGFPTSSQTKEEDSDDVTKTTYQYK